VSLFAIIMIPLETKFYKKKEETKSFIVKVWSWRWL